MSRPPEFLPLSDDAARAVYGPGGRHAALIEDAFKVLIETPGGGVSDVFGCGHVSKRSLSERISAMLCGLEAARADAQERIEDRLHEMDVFAR